MRLFGELTKIEDQPDGTLKVYGVASTGARDDAGEIVRPEAMKAALPDYARYPALREMHQPNAAGRTLEASVDDDGVTRIVAHVVDPVAVAKVKSRTYSGFSIGGKILARDPADATVITRIQLSEISLVDRPANPEAVIDLWKADAAAPSNTVVKAHAAELAAAAGRPGAWKDYVVKARAAMLNTAANDNDPPADPTRDADDRLPDDDGGAPDAAIEDAADAADRLAELARQDPATLQALHDTLAALGARCDPANCLAMEKASAASGLAETAPRFEALERRLAEQDALIRRLSAAPLPPRTAASAHAIGKAEDASPADDPVQKALAVLTPDERAFLLMKASLRQPIALA
jgi:phage head maturation protease